MGINCSSISVLFLGFVIGSCKFALQGFELQQYSWGDSQLSFQYQFTLSPVIYYVSFIVPSAFQHVLNILKHGFGFPLSGFLVTIS